MLERGNESELWHIGTATSGRYPKGSGARPYQHVRYTSKNIDKYSGEKIYKGLKKDIHKARAKRTNWSNQWLHQAPIGEETDRVVNEYRNKRDAYYNSKEMKDWDRKMKNLEKHYDDYDPDEYDKRETELIRKMPHMDFDDIETPVIYTKNGKEFLDKNFIHNGGKVMSLAYLKDLGYDNDMAKRLVDKMIKSNLTLGDI